MGRSGSFRFCLGGFSGTLTALAVSLAVSLAVRCFADLEAERLNGFVELGLEFRWQGLGGEGPSASTCAVQIFVLGRVQRAS